MEIGRIIVLLADLIPQPNEILILPSLQHFGDYSTVIFLIHDIRVQEKPL